MEKSMTKDPHVTAGDDEDDSTDLNFVKNGVIYIHGDFDYTICSKIVPQFKQLIEQQKKLKKGKIVIDISSPGGYISMLFELLALVEEAKKEDIIVETRSMSEAHSCGSMLLISGSAGHRYASPFSQVLIHHATQWSRHSTDIQLERTIDSAKRTNAIIKKLYKRYTKIPTKELDAMLSDDEYTVHSDKLVKFGIVDHITFKL